MATWPYPFLPATKSLILYVHISLHQAATITESLNTPPPFYNTFLLKMGFLRDCLTPVDAQQSVKFFCFELWENWLNILMGTTWASVMLPSISVLFICW